MDPREIKDTLNAVHGVHGQVGGVYTRPENRRRGLARRVIPLMTLLAFRKRPLASIFAKVADVKNFTIFMSLFVCGFTLSFLFLLAAGGCLPSETESKKDKSWRTKLVGRKQ